MSFLHSFLMFEMGRIMRACYLSNEFVQCADWNNSLSEIQNHMHTQSICEQMNDGIWLRRVHQHTHINYAKKLMHSVVTLSQVPKTKDSQYTTFSCSYDDRALHILCLIKCKAYFTMNISADRITICPIQLNSEPIFFS